MLGGPKTPNGASNWPLRLSGGVERGCLPIIDLPLSAWVISTVVQRPDSIAAAAWRTCSMKEQPPTDVPSTQVGVMPRYQAVSVGLAPAQATPSISEGLRPVSFIARMADSACRPSCESSGNTPIGLTISAAPTIATLPGFTTARLPSRAARAAV